MRPEARLEFEVLRAFGRIADVALYPNESGLFFTADGRRVHAGLGVGSPDLVGAVGGVFLGLELKSESGTVSENQAKWHAAARKRGLLVEVVRSVEEARDVIERARRGR